jgi:hypothetical protein
MARGKAVSRPASAPARARPQASAVESMPAWLPAAIYALITIILFREFFFAGGLLLGRDTYALSYTARNLYTEFVQQTGQFPLWNPYLFGGIPFVEGMHGDVFYPLSLALFFLDTRTMWGWKMVIHIFLAGVFTYLWLRGLGLRRAPAFFGGLLYMMGPDLVSLLYPGGDGKLFVSALAPLMFWLTDRAARRGRISDFAFFSLGLALVMFTSHMQLAYFMVWGVSLYFLFRVFEQWRAQKNTGRAARQVATFALAGALGVGAAAVQFVPPILYLLESSRRADMTVQAQGRTGYEYSTSYSLHPEEIVSLVVPEFIGDNVATETRAGNTYWGRNAIKFNHEYAGLVPLLLIPVLLIRRRDPTAIFFMVLGVLALLYALGANTPFFRLFYLIPFVKLFRAPSLTIFLYGLSVATLGAMGLQRLLDWMNAGAEQMAKARKLLWICAAVLGVLALLQSAGGITTVWQSMFEVGADKASWLDANMANIRLGFWLSFLIAAAVAGIVELMARGTIGWRGVIIAFSVIAALDMARVDRPFIRGTVLLGENPPDPALFEPDESIRFLQDAAAGGEVFRVFNAGYDTNVLATHGIEQVTGHHPNDLGRYRALVGGEEAANASLPLLDLINARYLVAGQRLEQIPPGFEEAFVGPRSVVYRNRNALPRAYLAGRIEVVPDPGEVARLLDPAFDRRTTILLPEALPPDVSVQPDPQGTVTWAERGINESTLRVTTDRPAFLVVSENYYPAWKVEVDGVATPLFRANYTFRAVPVPAGAHTVRFHYESDVVKASAWASIVTLLVLIALGLIGSIRREPSATGGA